MGIIAHYLRLNSTFQGFIIKTVILIFRGFYHLLKISTSTIQTHSFDFQSSVNSKKYLFIKHHLLPTLVQVISLSGGKSHSIQIFVFKHYNHYFRSKYHLIYEWVELCYLLCTCSNLRLKSPFYGEALKCPR